MAETRGRGQSVGGTFRAHEGAGPREAMQGWAEKKGRLNRSWKRRYFVEEGGKLEYFVGVGEGGGGAKRKGEFLLAGATVDCEDARVINLAAGSRTLTMRFEGPLERQQWAEHLEAAVNRATYSQLGVHAELGAGSPGRACSLCHGRMLIQRGCSRCHRQFCGSCIASASGAVVCKTCAWYEGERRKFDMAMSVLSGVQTFKKHSVALGGLKAGASTRYVTVSQDRSALIWAKKEAQLATTDRALPFSEVSDVLRGQQSDVFSKTGRPGRDRLCFSVVCAAQEVTLDLEAPTEAVAERWATAVTDVARFVTIVPPEDELGSSERDREVYENDQRQQREAEERRRAEERDARAARFKEELAQNHSPVLGNVLRKHGGASAAGGELRQPLLEPEEEGEFAQAEEEKRLCACVIL